MSNYSNRNPFVRFISFIWSFIKGYLMVIGLLATILPILFFYAAMHFSEGRVKESTKIPASEKIVVTLDLDGVIRDKEPGFSDEFFSRLLGEPLGIQLSDVHTTLKRAAEDPRVKGVFIQIKNIGGSLASFTSLQRILEQYKASQKPLYIHVDSADSKTYYLASAATHLSISPTGELFVPGPAFQLVYMGSALKKLGLKLEVVRAGKFKSAMEPFVEDQPTPETLTMYRSMEESIRDDMIKKIANGRKKAEGEVRQELKTSIFTAEQAMAAKMVDELAYWDTPKEALKASVQAEKFYDMFDYLDGSDDLDRPRMAHGHDEQIALIEAVGEIHMDGPEEGNIILPEPLIEELEWARDTDSVKSVVFRIDSPGGSALASDMIWNAVKSLAAKKPVVVSMGGVAASGGYYIAAPAQLILAEPTTITGSIGVISAMPNGQALAEKYGISFHMVTQSDRVGILNFGGKPSDADREILRHNIDQFYKTFITKVAEGRHLEVDRVDSLGQGRVYTGAEALPLKLVDRLGGLMDAFKEAKVLANLNPDRIYPVARYEGHRRSLSDCLKNPKIFMECMNDTSGHVIARSQNWIAASFHYLPGPVERVKDQLDLLLRGDTMLYYWDGYRSLSVIPSKG